MLQEIDLLFCDTRGNNSRYEANISSTRISPEILYKVKQLKRVQEKKIIIRKRFSLGLVAKNRTHGLFVVLFLITAAFRSQTGGFGESHTTHILEDN